MTSRPHRATGSARHRSHPGARRGFARVAALALGLALGAVVPGPLVTPTSAQTAALPERAPIQADADRAAAIEGQRRSVEDYTAAQAAAADAGGMPQLDFANPLTISQVVWLIVIFGLFVFLCSQYLLPPVSTVLGERRERIGADLDAAHAAKSEADAAAEAHKQGTDRARAEAQAAIAGAVQSATADANARTAVLNARLGEQVAAAEARIARARDAAMGALREVSVDATGALVERLAGIRDPGAVAAAVDRAMDARTVAAGGRA